MLRRLAWFGLVVTLVAGVGALGMLLWVRTSSGRAWVRQLALKHVPGLQLARVGGDLTRHIELYDVLLRDPSGRVVVRAERIVGEIDALALLRRRIDLTDV